MSSDGPVDLEKGTAEEVKAAPTKEVKSPRMSLGHMVFVDVVAVLQVLFTIGLMTYIFSLSDKWWTQLPPVAALVLLMGFALSFKPKTNYAMEPTPASDMDDDLGNKLLLAEK